MILGGKTNPSIGGGPLSLSGEVMCLTNGPFITYRPMVGGIESAILVAAAQGISKSYGGPVLRAPRDRPAWDAYTDDHSGLMDHLGIREFMVPGFCIGGPFIWSLLKRAPDRIVAAVLAHPSGFHPEIPDHRSPTNSCGKAGSLAIETGRAKQFQRRYRL